MGRDFPPADETGSSDPFVIARCMGKKTKTFTKRETLNPGFFETIGLIVDLPPIGDPDVINLILISLVSRSWHQFISL